MRTFILAMAAVAAASGILAALPDKEARKPKHDIKQVMKEAHKDGLLKKVTEGKAEKKEKERLLELYADLWRSTPPKGEKPSWSEKSGALVVSAAMALLEQEGAAEDLKAASNCKGCHDVHKKS